MRRIIQDDRSRLVVGIDRMLFRELSNYRFLGDGLFRGLEEGGRERNWTKLFKEGLRKSVVIKEEIWVV